MNKTTRYLAVAFVLIDMFVGCAAFALLYKREGGFLGLFWVLSLSAIFGVSCFIFWSALKLIKQGKI